MAFAFPIVRCAPAVIYTRRRVDAQTQQTQLVTADAYVLADGHEPLLQEAPA